MTANIVLQTSKVLTLDLDSSNTPSHLSGSELKWRQKNLLVKNTDSNGSFPALTRKQWLDSCLYNSWVKRVCVDLALGEQAIKLWADTCKSANKPIFVRITSDDQLPSCSQTNYWQIKRVLDWLAAFVLVAMLSPLMLLIALVIKIFTPGSILYSQWRVGQRGRLFKIYKFRTMATNAEQQHHQLMGNQNGLHKLEQDPRITSVGKFLRKYSLDELPQLFNVLRGEMSLVGPRPWALYDALRIEARDRRRLNAIPGMTGAWQVQGRSKLLDLKAVTKCDLEYLSNWSLTKDLQILLLTIPRVFTGSGAY